MSENDEHEREAGGMRCPECGGECVAVSLLPYQGILVTRNLYNPLTSKQSTLTARTCTSCGYTRLYAERPELLR